MSQKQSLNHVPQSAPTNSPLTAGIPNRRRARKGSGSMLWSMATIASPMLAFTALGADAVPAAATTNAPAASPAVSAAATTAVKDQSFKKPAWVSELSFGVKESYDNNIYLSGVEQKYAGALITVKEQASWVTTVSPKVGFNFIPLLGDQKVLDTLSLGYAPDFVTYHNGEAPNLVAGHDRPQESYTNHKVTSAIKGKSGDFSYGVENTFNYIDGSEEGLIYPGGRSAYATAAVRERREQIQDRSKVTLRYDHDKFFVRPTASLLYYDFMVRKDATAGYDNYADRYDVNGGVDFGYKACSKFTPTLGYRYGHQDQEQYSFGSPNYSTSDYHRVLAGVEAKPFKWLKLEYQGGPDFRSYVDMAPVNDHDPVKYYGEASATAELSANDTVAFKYKTFQWMSSTGRIPYLDNSYDLSYRHKFSSKLTFDLGGKVGASDYTSGNAATSTRNDLMYTISTGIRYAFNSNLSADLGYAMDLGSNSQENIVNPQNREFKHHLVSLGMQLKF